MAEKTTKTNTTVVKKKTFKNIAEGRLYIQSSFNNTIVTVTDSKGKTITWSSSGNCGFKGARRSTPFAATTAIEKTLEEAKKHGVKKLAVYLKGPGSGRDAALRYLRTQRDFDVDMISDITPIPHNGPRPPKQRRV